jgi:nucleoside-diphosphate-sugar epimerase
MKNILIVGGAGYIGTRLSNELSSKYNVTVVDNFWFGDFINDTVTKLNKNLWSLTVDDLKGFDVVMFLGGLANDPMTMFRPDLSFTENTAAPTYLAYLTKLAGIKKFICASSCSVYGHTKNKILDETSEVKPSYVYGISKLQMESGIMILKDDSFSPIIFRKGTVGGWSQKMRYDLVINTMIKSALTTGQIIVNNPDLWRPLIDIRDVIQGYELAIEVDSNVSGIYNISGTNLTIGDLGKTIHKELVNKGFNVELIVNDIKDVRNYMVDTTKIETELNYKSKYTVIDSLNDIFENINFNGYDFTKDIYYNIETFKRIII